MMSIFIGGKSYTTRENAESHMDVVPENLKSYFRTTRIEVDDMHATLRTHAHEIEKYSMLYHDEAERDAAWRAIEAAAPAWSWRPACPQHGGQRPRRDEGQRSAGAGGTPGPDPCADDGRGRLRQ